MGEEARLTLPWTHAQANGAVVLALVRHGRTEWNATGRFLGRTDVPLDGVGLEQARRLAVSLPMPFHATYASPLSRALFTARALGTEPVLVPELAELDQGALEGVDARTALAQHPDFFARWQVDPTDARVPGGETLRELQGRVMPTLERIARSHQPGELVGVFTHQMVIATATCVSLGEPLASWREHRVGNTQLTALAWHEDRWTVLVKRLALAPEAADEP